MTLAEIKAALPARTLITLAVGAAVALGFVAVFLIPEYRTVESLTAQVADMQLVLDQRRQLEPVVKALAEARSRVQAVGTVSGQSTVPVAEVGRLTQIFDELAEPLGVRLTSVAPDAASVTKDGLLAVRLTFLGQAEAVRRFMLTLGAFGPLVKVESATTVFGREGREYTLKCWLAVK
ncbi:hypothetical protein [Solidesulfovibrio sp.]